MSLWVPAFRLRSSSYGGLEQQTRRSLVRRRVAGTNGIDIVCYFSIHSAHFGTSVAPHGMIGTVEVEFFGEPSMMRSE
jgi:hypothetical protein